jgi:hypothetical protein
MCVCVCARARVCVHVCRVIAAVVVWWSWWWWWWGGGSHTNVPPPRHTYKTLSESAYEGVKSTATYHRCQCSYNADLQRRRKVSKDSTRVSQPLPRAPQRCGCVGLGVERAEGKRRHREEEQCHTDEDAHLSTQSRSPASEVLSVLSVSQSVSPSESH